MFVSRDTVEPELHKILCKELGNVSLDTRANVSASKAQLVARAARLKLISLRLLRGIEPEEEGHVEEVISHAGPTGHWPEGTLQLTPRNWSTRIYSALENARYLAPA